MQISLKQREAIVLKKCLESHRRVCVAELKLILLPYDIRNDVMREQAITQVLLHKLHVTMKKQPCVLPVGGEAKSTSEPGLPCTQEAGKLPAEGR